VLESYRAAGKVRQRHVVNLGWCSTLEQALQIAQKQLAVALEEIPPSHKFRQRLEAERPQRIARLKARVELLKNVVSKQSTRGDVFDTTPKSRAE
jgi:hypothetical protein